jgi:peroxiredoxin Q/BCP
VLLATLAALVGAGCRSTGGSPGGPSASASAQVAPLDTSWQRTAPRPLAPGDRAPDFEGIAHTGMRVRLSAFLDAPVIVYFYSADASPEDAEMARLFRDQWLRLHDRASMVIGVSADDRITHRDFATAERLPFLLVADGELAIARAFGVPVIEGRAGRVTFVVGKEGKVTHVFPDVNPGGHAAEIHTALESLPR